VNIRYWNISKVKAMAPNGGSLNELAWGSPYELRVENRQFDLLLW
jgi:hypothetical protein